MASAAPCPSSTYYGATTTSASTSSTNSTATSTGTSALTATTPTCTQPATAFAVGARVDARVSAGSVQLFPGTVAWHNSDGSYVVAFDHGEKSDSTDGSDMFEMPYERPLVAHQRVSVVAETAAEPKANGEDEEAIEEEENEDEEERSVGTIVSANDNGTFTVYLRTHHVKVPKASVVPISGQVRHQFAKGQSVHARRLGAAGHLPGKVAGVHGDGTFAVHFEDGALVASVHGVHIMAEGGEEWRARQALAAIIAKREEAQGVCYSKLPIYAASSASANLLPVPGLGFAADISLLVTMALRFAGFYRARVDVAELVSDIVASTAAVREKVTSQVTKKLASKAASTATTAAVVAVAKKKGLDLLVKKVLERVTRKIAKRVAILTGESFARKLVYKVGGQMATKTSVKIIPGFGSIIAATMATQMTYAAGHDLIREFDALYEDCITDARLAVEQVLGVSLAEPVEVEPLSTGCISVSNQTNATVTIKAYDHNSWQWISTASSTVYRQATEHITALADKDGHFYLHIYDHKGSLLTSQWGVTVATGKRYAFRGGSDLVQLDDA